MFINYIIEIISFFEPKQLIKTFFSFYGTQFHQLCILFLLVHSQEIRKYF